MANKYPKLSLDDLGTLEEAMSQISDVINMACGDIDPDECEVSTVEQVEQTREAMARAGKVLTKWRRKGVAAEG